MKLDSCTLSALLTAAKEAHTRYEERFHLDNNPVPEHKWEDWYARFIIRELAEQEQNAKWKAIAAYTPSDGFADVTGPQPGEVRKGSACNFADFD